MEDFKYKYITYDDQYSKPQFVVKGVGTYEPSSVLAGQDKIVFLDSFDTLQEAQDAFPMADELHPLMQPQNNFDHLPDNGDGW